MMYPPPSVGESRFEGLGDLEQLMAFPPPSVGEGWGGGLKARFGRSYGERPPNGFDHAHGILEHVVIPKSQDPETFGFQPSGPHGIALGFHGMLAAVDLDHKPFREADKIGDVWANGRLAAESAPVELPFAEKRP